MRSLTTGEYADLDEHIRSRINPSIVTDCRMFRPRRPSSTVYKTVRVTNPFLVNVAEEVEAVNTSQLVEQTLQGAWSEHELVTHRAGSHTNLKDCAGFTTRLLGDMIQWNLSIKDTPNKGHLLNGNTFCSPNDIELCMYCTNLPLN